MGKTFRKHTADRRAPKDKRRESLKSNKQRRRGERLELRREYR